jgi:hypothetical protein
MTFDHHAPAWEAIAEWGRTVLPQMVALAEAAELYTVRTPAGPPPVWPGQRPERQFHVPPIARLVPPRRYLVPSSSNRR